MSSWSASGWAKESYSDDVDVVGERLVGVELGDDDAVSVRVEQVGQPDHDDVVVVDQRDT